MRLIAYHSSDDGAMTGPNVWPDLPVFRDVTSASHLLLAWRWRWYKWVAHLDKSFSAHATVSLWNDLFPLFVRALCLSPDFFDNKVRIYLYARLVAA